MTDFKIFGGNYLLWIYLGFVAAYLIPFAINWHWGNVTALAFEGSVAPTGYYEKGALNAGRNIWTFDHTLQLTWQLPLDNGLSMTLGYRIISKIQRQINVTIQRIINDEY